MNQWIKCCQLPVYINKNWLHRVSVYCTVSVGERSLWAKTQQSHECVCAPLCGLCMLCMASWCVCVFLLTPSGCSGTPAKTKQRDKLRKQKRSLRIKGTLVIRAPMNKLADPRKPGAYLVAHTHTNTYMLIQSLSTSLSLLRATWAKNMPDTVFFFTSASSLLIWIPLTF